MRFDRQLTLFFGKVMGSKERRALPILMYHSISTESEEEVDPYYRLVTTPKRFAEHMQWLFDSGYVGVSLEEAFRARHDGADGRRLVAITFDDGLRDFYTEAWPVLQQHGFKATMYLPTAFVSDSNKLFHGRSCLSWSEVREMNRQGIRFGSHTVTHPKLHRMALAEIETELAQSKAEIEDEVGEPVSSFAYPFAFPQEDKAFVGRFLNTLVTCGYQSCVTTMIGRPDSTANRLLLPRLPINDCDDGELFRLKIAGAYDWMASAQLAVRRAKSLGRWTMERVR